MWGKRKRERGDKKKEWNWVAIVKRRREGEKKETKTESGERHRGLKGRY